MKLPSVCIFGGKEENEIEHAYKYVRADPNGLACELNESCLTKEGTIFRLESNYRLEHGDFTFRVYENGKELVMIMGELTENTRSAPVLLFTASNRTKYQVSISFAEYDSYNNV